ncbi:MAG: Ig-like domain-containing protein [Terriglobia bacterium]
MRNSRGFLLTAAFLCAAAWLSSCGGGGYSTPPAPTITSVTVACNPTTIATGATSQCTATVTGTGGFSPAVSWTSSKTAVATVDSSGKVTGVAIGSATITATSTQDPTKSGTATVTVVAPLAVSVSASAATVNTGASVTLSATVMGGTGSATVAWTAAAGTFNPTTGLSTTYTAPATVPSPAIVTITATATDPTGSATATANVTVQRVITISLDPSVNLPNNEIYSDFGVVTGLKLTCAGCLSTDTLNVLSTFGTVTTTPFSQLGNLWLTTLLLDGIHYVPGLIKIWVTGTDGTSSNTLHFVFTGSQNVAVQDPTSGEMYYYNSGNGTSGSGAILKFKPDGTADGSCTSTSGVGSGPGEISLDNQTGYIILAGDGGTGQLDPNCNLEGGASLSSLSLKATATDARDGLACITVPQIDAAYCYYVQAAKTNSNVLFAIPGIPSGSQPAAVKVFDATHIVIYGRGDQTLRWYTISGTTATAAGTLALSEFTPTDANYWGAYPVTGGWYLASVGGTLCVMGQVVNADGTVSQKLALVNNTNQTATQYVSLPAGAIRIASDPTNNAVVAEYPDLSGASPVTRFARIFVDTGNTAALTSTSNLVPGAGFLVTNDGSHIAVFVEGQIDLQPNQ